MRISKRSIFVLSLFDTGILTAKCVYKYKIPVLGFDYNKYQLGFYSKYLTPYISPHPTEESEKLVEYLINIRKQFEEKPILIPASDEYVSFINKNREVMEKYFLFLLPEKEIADSFLSKAFQLSLSLKWGMDIPAFKLINRTNIASECEKFKYPVFVKPNDFLSKKIFVEKGFVVINSGELINKIKDLNNNEAFVQEIVNGGSDNNYEVNVLYLKDELIFTQTVRKIRQFPDNFGTGCLLETTENTYLEELTKKFIIDHKVYGFSNTEYKYSEKDDKFYFIETNIRPWLQIDLTMSANNFVKIYYEFLSNNKIEYKINNVIKKEKWLDIINDLQLAYKLYKNGELSLIDWIKSYKGIKSCGVFSLFDLRIVLRELDYGKKIIEKVIGK